MTNTSPHGSSGGTLYWKIRQIWSISWLTKWGLSQIWTNSSNDKRPSVKAIILLGNPTYDKAGLRNSPWVWTVLIHYDCQCCKKHWLQFFWAWSRCPDQQKRTKNVIMLGQGWELVVMAGVLQVGPRNVTGLPKAVLHHQLQNALSWRESFPAELIKHSVPCVLFFCI